MFFVIGCLTINYHDEDIDEMIDLRIVQVELVVPILTTKYLHCYPPGNPLPQDVSMRICLSMS